MRSRWSAVRFVHRRFAPELPPPHLWPAESVTGTGATRRDGPRHGGPASGTSRIRFLAILTGVSLLAVLPPPVGAEAVEAPLLVRANLGPQEVQANENIIDRPAISADGRYVAFASAADNLVEGDTAGWIDIFVRDQLTRRTVRVNVAPTGAQADGASFAPSISADGRYVAYDSYATNLAPADDNGAADVFLHDSLTATTRLVSTGRTGGAAAGDSTTPSVSANGRYVAYDSTAADLVAGDTNGFGDVFVWDAVRGVTVRASVGTAGDGTSVQGDAGSGFASLSADGSRVAFTSAAENLAGGDTNGAHDIYVRDLTSGVTELVSLAVDGKQGNANADAPALSAAGTHVAFEAAARLSPQDRDRSIDVYVRDLLAGTTTLVSGATTPTPAGTQRGISYGPAISANGRYVSFTSFADDLVPADRNRFQEAYLRDMLTGTVSRIAVNRDGVPGTAASYGTALSPDGAHLAFCSAAPNLVAGDSNNAHDAFVWALVTPSMSLASGVHANGQSAAPGPRN
jgi:Tol biopolymer transport system component